MWPLRKRCSLANKQNDASAYLKMQQIFWLSSCLHPKDQWHSFNLQESRWRQFHRLVLIKHKANPSMINKAPLSTTACIKKKLVFGTSLSYCSTNKILQYSKIKHYNPQLPRPGCCEGSVHSHFNANKHTDRCSRMEWDAHMLRVRINSMWQCG